MIKRKSKHHHHHKHHKLHKKHKHRKDKTNKKSSKSKHNKKHDDFEIDLENPKNLDKKLEKMDAFIDSFGALA